MEKTQRYIAVERLRATELNSKRLLMWWRSRECRYPYLSQVVKAVLGSPASSAQTERDFGVAGSLLSSKRNKIDSAFVDISLFLNCNSEIIQMSIPEITAKNWQEKIPARMTATEELTENLSNDAMNHNTVEDLALFPEFDSL
ncbi:hypothetical protein BWQ96_04340 [Gracilariopsis chorda]|uniref:HAT C-terminal dimerisation domain-containing protein n=1 Tax=Gracilariopsis chorda TaxID=448386 RepID=A0A2V3IUX2_9FLOR|nr:hypothetical protein BWQ96_04340 [Gracilariopsis chorda]|eukprot:PXF45905.1 hypothetical protein BWQ96_04340 [Gracilariopsis chorda]